MPDVCIEKHKRIDEMLLNQKCQIAEHDGRIDVLERFRSGTEVEIKNLVEQIRQLVNVIKWMMGLAVTTLLSLAIWFFQQILGRGFN